MSRLFEISSEFSALFDQLEDLTEQAIEAGIPQEEAETAWFDTLDGIEEEFNQKAENIAVYIKELIAKADAIRQEEKRLFERRKSCEHHVAALKNYLMQSMLQMQQKKIDGIRSRITIRNNPPMLQIADEAALIQKLQISGQDDLLRYKLPDLQKTKIKSYLQAGGQIDGCSLVQTKSLQIK